MAKGKCSEIITFLLILGSLLLALIVVLAVGIPVNKHVHNNQFHQYQINSCNSSQCVPHDQTNDYIYMVQNSNQITLPLCKYAEDNNIIGKCITPVTSQQCAYLCMVYCNFNDSFINSTCTTINCNIIYTCVSNESYDRNQSVITITYGQNYSIVVNNSNITANHFADNADCVTYGNITDKSFNIQIQSIQQYPPYDAIGSCIVTIDNITTKILYPYQINNLTTNEITCNLPNQIYYFCLYNGTTYISQCNSIKNYSMNRVLFGLIIGFSTLIGIVLTFFLIFIVVT